MHPCVGQGLVGSVPGGAVGGTKPIGKYTRPRNRSAATECAVVEVATLPSKRFVRASTAPSIGVILPVLSVLLRAASGLTRVALRKGSLVVNSSQGGGSKDTWVLRADDGRALKPADVAVKGLNGKGTAGSVATSGAGS